MGKFKDLLGVFKSNPDKDGYARQDRFNYDKNDKSKHDHSWSKSDRMTGKHQEGHTGSNVPRSRDGNKK